MDGFDNELGLSTFQIIKSGASYSVTNEGLLIVKKTSGSATTINLPPVNTLGIRRLVRVLDGKGDAAANNITLVPKAGNTILGGANYVLNRNYGAVMLCDTGTTDWGILSASILSTAELAQLSGITAGTASGSQAAILGANKQLDTMALATPVIGTSATPGAANQTLTISGKKTGIADNTATSILRITCPNGSHTAILNLTLLAAVNNAGVLDSARGAFGLVVFDRVTGAALVGTATALTNTGIATSGTATLTLAYSVATVSGAVGATNTMDVQVTLVKTGGTNHQCMFLAELMNSEASGMTIAAV